MPCLEFVAPRVKFGRLEVNLELPTAKSALTSWPCMQAGLDIWLVLEIGLADRAKIKSRASAEVEGWGAKRFGSETVLSRLDVIGQVAAVKLGA